MGSRIRSIFSKSFGRRGFKAPGAIVMQDESEAVLD
jgi:hypothetical protein